MPRVVLSGYYGFQNAGDEAILYSIIKALRKVSPDIEMLVLSNSPSETSLRHGVEAANRWCIKEIYSEIRKSDLFISGGGSLLQDVTGLKSLVYYLGIVFLAKLLGKPVMFYAQGIGPINSFIGRVLTKIAADRVDLITVRDENSRK
ncbi:MAG: polysaccharide pyruvyl transferase CsaB, partial [Clostridia bacterium]|nr:polysaccharide pyruvyl transferase CsaB [Clostridia bacterium]